jgi:hypothetical protein
MFFTRKQRWRRTRGPKKSCDENENHEDDDEVSSPRGSETGSMCSSSSSPRFYASVSTADLEDQSTVEDKAALVTRQQGDHSPAQLPISDRSHVRFCNRVRVVLIPTREELSHLYAAMYYSPEECDTFKQESLRELENFRESQEFRDCKNELSDLVLRTEVSSPTDKLLESRSFKRDSIRMKSGNSHAKPSRACLLPFVPPTDSQDQKRNREYLCSLRLACTLLYQPWPCLGTNCPKDVDGNHFCSGKL